MFPLSENSAVKVTVVRYFRPKGREIQAHGITPDVVIVPAAGKEAGMETRDRHAGGRESL